MLDFCQDCRECLDLLLSRVGMTIVPQMSYTQGSEEHKKIRVEPLSYFLNRTRGLGGLLTNTWPNVPSLRPYPASQAGVVGTYWPRVNLDKECIIYLADKEYIGIHGNRRGRDSVVTN